MCYASLALRCSAFAGRAFRTAIILLLAPFFFSTSAEAVVVQFGITGTGANGTIASGIFTLVDGGNSIYYTPGYFAPGGIFSGGSLTLSNIPGGGPSTVTFSGINELGGSWFVVDNNGVQYIAPYGEHSYGPPDQHWYATWQPSQPFYPSSLIYQSQLVYDGREKDLITWSPVVSVTAVPEPSTYALMLAGLGLIGFVARRRTRSLHTVAA